MRVLAKAWIAAARTELNRVQFKCSILQGRLRLHLQEKYGPMSATLSDAQLELLDAEPCVTAEEVAAEADRVAKDPEARTPRTLLEDRAWTGHKEPVYLDPAGLKLFLHEARRGKPSRPARRDAAASAPRPARVMPQNKIDDELVIEILEQKFGMHTPLFRVGESIVHNTGADLSRQAMCAAISRAGQLLVPVGRALKLDLLEGGYIQAQESRLEVQGSGKVAQCQKAQIWQYARPGGPVVFEFRRGGGRAGPEEIFNGFRGHLQCDSAVDYRNLSPGITYCGCLAQVLRKFVEAALLEPSDPWVEEIVNLLAEVYAIEALARKAGATAAQRLQMRQARIRTMMENLHLLIEAAGEDTLPQSAVGKACAYALDQWSRLQKFLSHGEIEIENSISESAFEPVVLGRRRFVHVDAEWVGPKLAAIWTLYGTCQRLGVKTKDYLRSVLPRLPGLPIGRVAELTPLVWKK